MNKKLKKIQKIRRKGNPFLYINSLLNLFEVTLSNSFIHLFIKSVGNPRIISNSKYLKNKSYDDQKFIIDKEKIKKFNVSFINKEKKSYEKKDYLEIEDLDDFVEEKENDEYLKKEPEEEDKYVEKEEEEEDEDNDEYEEEKKGSQKNKNKNEIIDEEEDEDDEYFDKNKNSNEDKVIFPILINNEIITKLFELHENKQKNIEYNNLLIQQSNEYSIKLSKFLKLHNLLS